MIRVRGGESADRPGALTLMRIRTSEMKVFYCFKRSQVAADLFQVLSPVPFCLFQ